MNKSGFSFLCGACALLLSACGGSPSPQTAGGSGAMIVPPDAPGTTNEVPATPADGESRPGTFYDVYIEAPATGDTVAMTVFEPLTLEGGKTYPLVLHSHGFSASRQRSTPSDPASGSLSPGNVDSLLAAGYGVISIDERGHGESGGTIRVMDPDAEGQDLLAVLDWAQARLDWLQFRNGNLVLGSVGGSYGGMYQMLIQNIDLARRPDAQVIQIAPNDLTYSLFPNGTIKAAWDTVLFGIGNTAGSNEDRGHFDPFVIDFFTEGFTTNQVSAAGRDFFYYHSNQYFCGSQTVASNGGPGTAPLYAPGGNGAVNAMFFQGFRDTLFNFNEAYANYQCYAGRGGDVRLLSYQYGHNSLQVVPDPGALAFQDPSGLTDTRCGNVDVDAATVAFFDQYLKGIPGAADSVPARPCLSLALDDAVLVDAVTTGRNGTEVMIPATNLIAGVINVPIAVDLGLTAGAQGEVIAGIPQLEVDVAPTIPGTPGEPILFAGIGQMRASAPGVWDLIDNQLTPLRGTGHFDLPLVGIAERLAPGDTLALLLYGGHDQYHITGSVNIANPTVMPVTVSGRVWVPLLGPLPNAAAP